MNKLPNISHAIIATGDPGLSENETIEAAMEAETATIGRERAKLLAADVERERHESEAWADAIECVARARKRKIRNVCSPHDGKLVREIARLLLCVQGSDGGSDSDPAWSR